MPPYCQTHDMYHGWEECIIATQEESRLKELALIERISGEIADRIIEERNLESWHSVQNGELRELLIQAAKEGMGK